jgi:hypothetical protein
MKAESKFPSVLLDFIQSFGDLLIMPNQKYIQGITEIICKYHISDEHSEPYYQNQNPAEQNIQEIKSMTNMTMDCVGVALFLPAHSIP